MDPSYLPTQQSECKSAVRCIAASSTSPRPCAPIAKQIINFAAEKLSELSAINDRVVFQKMLSNITNEVIGVLDKRSNREAVTPRSINGGGQSKPSGPTSTGYKLGGTYIDKELLKTPSGQMLQKLKELRASINRNLFDNSEQPMLLSIPIPDMSSPRQQFNSDAEGSIDRERSAPGPRELADEGCGRESDADRSANSSDAENAKLSLGDQIVCFQNYFIRVADSKKCSVDTLIDRILQDSELRRSIEPDVLGRMRARLVEHQSARDRCSLTMSQFLNIVLHALSRRGTIQEELLGENELDISKGSVNRVSAFAEKSEIPINRQPVLPESVVSPKKRSIPPPRRAVTKHVFFSGEISASPEFDEPVIMNSPGQSSSAAANGEKFSAPMVPAEENSKGENENPVLNEIDRIDLARLLRGDIATSSMSTNDRYVEKAKPLVSDSRISSTSLPTPMSGTAAFGFQSPQIERPAVTRAKKLPMPINFLTERDSDKSGEISVSFEKEPSRVRRRINSGVSLGDSIDLSGMTIENLRGLLR